MVISLVLMTLRREHGNDTWVLASAVGNGLHNECRRGLEAWNLRVQVLDAVSKADHHDALQRINKPSNNVLRPRP